jgi:MoaA/NifB/PqqE/SkfB family radical SAM enzyme
MADAPEWLLVFVRVSACACRCRHCDFDAPGTDVAIPVEGMIELLTPHVEAQAGRLAVVFRDAPLADPDLPRRIRWLRERDVEGWLSIPANGFPHRPADEWRAFLREIRAAGTEYLEFTLYGLAGTHDRFAGRPGDFDALLDTGRLWRNLGGRNLFAIVPHAENLEEIEALRSLVNEEFGEPCRPAPFTDQGRGAEIAHLRSDAAEVAKLFELDSLPTAQVPPVRRIVMEPGELPAEMERPLK